MFRRIKKLSLHSELNFKKLLLKKYCPEVLYKPIIAPKKNSPEDILPKMGIAKNVFPKDSTLPTGEALPNRRYISENGYSILII